MDYYEQNRVKIIEKTKEYYHTHKEEQRKKQKEYYMRKKGIQKSHMIFHGPSKISFD
jgi:hypothetical protein